MPDRCRGLSSADQELREGVIEHQTDEDQILSE
jgi:hypothetical protein